MAKSARVYPSALTVGWMKLFSIIRVACASAALISGAQVISTDYYQPDPAFGTGYHVQLPGNQPGRWNPLLLPEDWPLPALE